MTLKLRYLCLLIPLVPGCASIEHSTLLGAGMLGAVGAGIGVAVERSAGSTMIGLGAGAAFGAGMGYLFHQERDRKLSEANGPTPKENGEAAPQISTPEIRRVWIPPRVEGSKYEEGRWIWVIEKPTVWRK